ncbi:hypothetical protein [Nevskia sp.]|uniref:hypothetical protein n=1 Tax=Nevskia sp. TaxID=1929292 RepID=UPI0025DC8BB2|nr:hypothetical protein [Nevskia sp.]
MHTRKMNWTWGALFAALLVVMINLYPFAALNTADHVMKGAQFGELSVGAAIAMPLADADLKAVKRADSFAVPRYHARMWTASTLSPRSSGRSAVTMIASHVLPASSLRPRPGWRWSV